MNIKVNNKKFGRGMELNGNTLSGDTYPAREIIKETWGGKWNANSRTWTVDAEKVVSTINNANLYVNTWFSIEDSAPAAEIATTTRKHHAGICPKCHSYCDGDCEAN